MNLLQRLKPEVLESINSDIEKYPTLVRMLKSSLETNSSICSMTIEDASHLCQYNNTILSTDNLFNCFV